MTGEGEPVVFVQGVGVHGEGWRPQVAELATQGFRCLYFDNRGLGRNADLLSGNDPLTVDQMAADGLSILGAAGMDRAHLVGHSLGGLIVLRMAQMRPSCARSLTLMCTFGNGASAAPLGLRMMWYGLRSRAGTRAMRRQGFLGLVMPPPAPRGERAEVLARELAGLFGHDLADQPPIVGRQLGAMRKSNAMPGMGDLAAIPALVMSARHDPIAPPACGRAIAGALPGSRYVEVPDASHGLPITHAGVVNEELRRFLLTCTS